jgi:hypothetical protein
MENTVRTTIVEEVRGRIRTSSQAITKLSYATQIPLPTLYDFKNGFKKLSIANIQKLCDYFGLVLTPLEKDGATPRR